MGARFCSLLREELRFLSFRSPGADFAERRRALLALGLCATWLAGIGRYWDNPRASLFQHLGLGSVAYAFVLAAILWVVVRPLRPRHWSYGNVLLFVCLTAPPAVLYAIPVERFLSLELAATINVWFLGVVAAWRVALLCTFLRRTAGLGWIEVTTAALLPMTAIVTVLAVLNLEHVVFDLMAGLSEEQRGPNDGAYLFVLWLTEASLYAGPVLFLVYLGCVARRARAPATAVPRDPDAPSRHGDS
ncbi:MAG: hypothetical protein IPK67_07565 [Planctomycetes bacterium]|nr:hypothetical protein [Planctomycetota bacterium]